MGPFIRVTPGPNDPPPLSGGSRSALARVKSGFFDRSKVLAAMDEATHVALLKAGAWVRKVAQRSMRYRKTASAPGTPPSARSGQEGSLLRRFLFFAYDEPAKQVVVGPLRLGAEADVPRLHEYGGTRKAVRRKPKQVGQTGPISIVDGGDFKVGPSTRPVKGDPKQRQVVYVRLRTAAMAQKATEIEEMLYAHLDAKYPPRPYMRPALESSSEMIAKFWANSLGRKRGSAA